MELARKSLRTGLSTRSGAIAAAAVAALIAAVLVFTALNKARSDAGGGQPAVVLVANSLIAKGTSGASVATEGSFRVAKVRESALVAGAVTDVSQLRGKVATDDIYPGQQLSAADFGAAGGALTARLTSTDRAISVPVDAAHGMLGQLHAGDRVDVYAGFNVEGGGRGRPVMKVLAQDVAVLKAPKDSAGGVSGGSNGQVTLRLKEALAANVAFAVDNGKVWIALRPGGARAAKPRLVTMESLLFGVPTVNVRRAVRGR